MSILRNTRGSILGYIMVYIYKYKQWTNRTRGVYIINGNIMVSGECGLYCGVVFHPKKWWIFETNHFMGYFMASFSGICK